MWLITAICSDPACGAIREVVVERPDDEERLICDCGYCLVTLAVAGFEPVRC
jgi:hypothetical protein